MRLLSIETGYRDTEALFYLTDYTDVHGSNSVISVRDFYAE